MTGQAGGRLRPPKTPSFPPTTWLGGLIRPRRARGSSRRDVLRRSAPRTASVRTSAPSGQREPRLGEAPWADQRRLLAERPAEQEVLRQRTVIRDKGTGAGKRRDLRAGQPGQLRDESGPAIGGLRRRVVGTRDVLEDARPRQHLAHAAVVQDHRLVGTKKEEPVV